MARAKEFECDHVLEKAMCLFWSRGYEATGIQELVDATGISRSSLYDTFGDKRGLFLAALEHYVSHRSTQLLRYLDNPDAGLNAIQELFQAQVEYVLAQDNDGCMLVDTTASSMHQDADVEKILHSNRNALEIAFERVLQQAQLRSEIHAEANLTDLARFLTIVHLGLAIYGKLKPERKQLEDAVGVVMSVLQSNKNK